MEDRRFAALLRSVLALSLATPAGIVVACSSKDLFPPVSRGRDATTDAGTDGGDAAVSALDATCVVPDSGTYPPGAWEGGMWEGSYWPPAPDSFLYYPDAGVGCGLAKLPVTYERCVAYEQFPCCAPPVLPLSSTGGGYPLAACRAHCEDTPTRPLLGCSATNEVVGAPASSPILVCDYRASDPSTECGCVELPPITERNPCGWGVQLPCGIVPPDAAAGLPLDATVCDLCYAGEDAGMYPVPNLCTTARGPGGLYISCQGLGCPGRRPAGLEGAAPAQGTPVGAWLADAAHLEAASVDAFALLAAELRLHQAPASLIERAQRAEADEIRHARMTAKLARRLGASEGAWAGRVRRADVGRRTLEEIAHENAVEGCVNETFAAVLAMWQADHAKDEAVRDAMRVIAEDEASHAALAWSVLAWTQPRLSPDAATRVDQALRTKLEMLVSASVEPAPTALVAAGILPDAPQAERLVTTLAAALGRELARAR